MVKVRGSSYTTKSCPSLSRSRCSSSHSTNKCYTPPTCTGNRTIRTGPSYVSRSLVSPLLRPSYYSYSRPFHFSYHRPPATVIIDPSHETTTIVHSNKQDSNAAAITILALLALGIAIAVGTSISRDCHLIETECTEPDFWGDRVCTPIYNCKW